MEYDFCGWATKNNIKCSDGRVIRHGAFKTNDGKEVPLVWNHEHNDPSKILGKVILQHRDEGVYAYGTFNESQKAKDAKEAVKHGDVVSMSIWANQLDQHGSDVLHGNIKEVSLVVAGANPGAYIESVMAHGEPADEYDDEAIFYSGENIELAHSDDSSDNQNSKGDTMADNKKSSEDKTLADVYNTLNEEQKKMVAVMIGLAVTDAKKDDSEKDNDGKGDNDMKHNIFDTEGNTRSNVLSHSDMEQIIESARRCGSLKEAFNDAVDSGILAHTIDTTGMDVATGTQTYGFNDPDMLFPEYKNMNGAAPEWISRDMGWVQKVMGGVHHTPFSRIKSVFANITEDEARAKGYIKGNQKKTEVFSTLKRRTNPTTVYKFQKMDRDDVIDITDFDVISWIKAEMRVMLNEEIARAILIGDGRLADAEDKIPPENIRPIVTDVPLFNTKYKVTVSSSATGTEISKEIINSAIRSRKNYKGSGTPTFFTTEDTLTEMLLIEDNNGRKIYKSEAELATALRVSSIVTVEPMEGMTVDELPLIGIIVNLSDYNVGADKGGAVSIFDDFDLDFNKLEYLIETRISGALVKPYSAITLLMDKGTSTASYTNKNTSKSNE